MPDCRAGCCRGWSICTDVALSLLLPAEYIDGPINLFGMEGEVDVMIESKGKELALLEYRQYIIEGNPEAVAPRTARAARFAAEAKAAAEAAAAEGSSDEDGKEFDSSTEED